LRAENGPFSLTNNLNYIQSCLQLICLFFWFNSEVNYIRNKEKIRFCLCVPFVQEVVHRGNAMEKRTMVQRGEPKKAGSCLA